MRIGLWDYEKLDKQLANKGGHELRGRLPAERSSLVEGLEKMGSGRRFWFFVLHHPHWGSEAEHEAIAGVFAERAVPLHRVEGLNASATLYRTR